ncbi:MAG: hypothetical protein EXS16_05575 [Gemmataceae bacterium]|nr:hypothetical protein [Gemmataceae bacterium]
MKFVARYLFGLGLLFGCCASSVHAQDYKGKDEFDFVHFCRRLKGRMIDHTGNHGKDHRIWSRSLHQWRDLYVYLPPGYTPSVQYPFMLYLHPFCMDERTFLDLVPLIDDAIASGKLPPLIVAAPDGSMDGRGNIGKPGSMFLNSRSGPFEDFILADVWDFVTQRYPIRPEREAHILAGASMGGFAAFNIGLRHRNAFGIVIGVHPALNLRWCDVNGNPRAKFDPRKWAWRTSFDNPTEVIADYYGLAKIRTAQFIEPVFGIGDEAMVNIVWNNPLELAIRTGLRNGELSMFVGYAGRDEFNIDAQVESFLYYAKHRGWGVAVAFEPDGRHDGPTALKFVPAIVKWLGPQIQPYAPTMKMPTTGETFYPATKKMPETQQAPAIYPNTRLNGAKEPPVAPYTPDMNELRAIYPDTRPNALKSNKDYPALPFTRMPNDPALRAPPVYNLEPKGKLSEPPLLLPANNVQPASMQPSAALPYPQSRTTLTLSALNLPLPPAFTPATK